MIDFSRKGFRAILDEMMAKVANTYDKRDTSPIPTALSPAAYALEGVYLSLDQIQRAAYVQTAVGESLDLLAAIGGISRAAATPAVRAGTFDAAVPLGARFSTIAGATSINFSVTGITDGYQLTAETPGSIGNDYAGPILPITTIPGLTEALLGDILIPGEDTETDDALRARLIDALNARPFGGNIAAYRQAIGEINGVGGVQVYPTWDGGGTVKCSVLGADLLPAPPALVQLVQDTIDPIPNTGKGLGLAPIGAKVTVVSPESVTAAIGATVSLAPGYTLDQVRPIVVAALESKMADIRSEWDSPTGSGGEYALVVYLSQISAIIVTTQGITNATGVTINGQASDLVLTQSETVQQVPVLGEVTLSATP